MIATKRKPKRRKQHRLSYYLAELANTTDPRRIEELVDDAAHQPPRVLSNEDYERVYWLAHDLRKEN